MGKKPLYFICIIAAVFIMTAFAPHYSYAQRGVTDTTIKVGAWHDLSGNLTFYSTAIMNGARTYFKKINELGGVHGRKFEYIGYDDG
jgi:branched-chain amino acid transport system substrate-binding protein